MCNNNNYLHLPSAYDVPDTVLNAFQVLRITQVLNFFGLRIFTCLNIIEDPQEHLFIWFMYVNVYLISY